MRRLIAVLLAVSLLWGTASAKIYRVENAFALSYPSDWTYDNVTYCQDNTEESVWLVDLYDDQFLIEVYMDYYSDLADFSLFSANARERRSYAEDLEWQLTDEETQADWIDTIETRSGVPFVLVELEDEDGEYLYAETMASGWAIYLIGYSPWETELAEDCVETFREVVASFSPMT